MKIKTIIKGINGSKAIKDEDGVWTIIGAHDVLDEQNDDELAYKADLTWKEIKKLPKDTPIYAPVDCFQPKVDKIGANYSDTNDFLESAKSCIKLCYEGLNKKDKKRMVDMDHVTTDMINDIADRLWDELTWQSLEAYESDFIDDMTDSLDSYDCLLIK